MMVHGDDSGHELLVGLAVLFTSDDASAAVVTCVDGSLVVNRPLKCSWHLV